MLLSKVSAIIRNKSSVNTMWTKILTAFSCTGWLGGHGDCRRCSRGSFRGARQDSGDRCRRCHRHGRRYFADELHARLGEGGCFDSEGDAGRKCDSSCRSLSDDCSDLPDLEDDFAYCLSLATSDIESSTLFRLTLLELGVLLYPVPIMTLLQLSARSHSDRW